MTDTDTTTAPPARYADGWQDALNAVRRDALNPDTCCLGCTLDRLAFQGIVAALATDDEPMDPGALTDRTVDHLINLLSHPDPEVQASVVTAARTLVRDTPAIAAQVLVTYAINIARHYGRTNL